MGKFGVGSGPRINNGSPSRSLPKRQPEGDPGPYRPLCSDGGSNRVATVQCPCPCRTNRGHYSEHAVGNWTLTVEDIATIPHSDGPVSGTGDDVVVLTSGTKAAISYQGESNFVIQTYGDRNDLAVNTIRAYEGTVKISTPAFIQVTASGPWSITPQ